MLVTTYYLSDKVKENGEGGTCDTSGSNVYQVYVREPKGKESPGIPWFRW